MGFLKKMLKKSIGGKILGKAMKFDPIGRAVFKNDPLMRKTMLGRTLRAHQGGDASIAALRGAGGLDRMGGVGMDERFAGGMGLDRGGMEAPMGGMQTGGGAPPTQMPGNTGIVPPHMQTGGGAPPMAVSQPPMPGPAAPPAMPMQTGGGAPPTPMPAGKIPGGGGIVAPGAQMGPKPGTPIMAAALRRRM